MAVATSSDLQRFMRSYYGRMTIGSSSDDTLTSTEATSFLNDAEAQICQEYSCTPSDFTGYILTLVVKLECLMVIKALMQVTKESRPTLDTIIDEIDTLKRTIQEKPSISMIESVSELYE